jgi:hypothetical protein
MPRSRSRPRDSRIRKKIVLALVIGLGALGAGTAVLVVPDGSPPAGPASSVREGTRGGNQIPAPPRPPRLTPIERVVVGSR